MKRDMSLIRAARKILDEPSQAALAAAVKHSEPTIRRIEANNPKVRPHIIERVAHHLGLAFDPKTEELSIPPTMPRDKAERIRVQLAIERARAGANNDNVPDGRMPIRGKIIEKGQMRDA